MVTQKTSSSLLQPLSLLAGSSLLHKQSLGPVCVMEDLFGIGSVVASLEALESSRNGLCLWLQILFDYPGALWQVATWLCWVGNSCSSDGMTHLRLKESSVTTWDVHADVWGRE